MLLNSRIIIYPLHTLQTEVIKMDKEKATVDGKSNKKNINQNQGHNSKKEALGPNTKR